MSFFSRSALRVMVLGFGMVVVALQAFAQGDLFELGDYVPLSLSQELAEKKSKSAGMIDESSAEIMKNATAQIAELNIPENSIQEGETAPDFSLPDINNETVNLSALLENGPVVLKFYRGGWCMYCNIELRSYERAYPQLQAYNATLVAISPETQSNGVMTQEKHGLSFPVLTDSGNQVAKSYGLVFQMPEELRGLYEEFGIDLKASNGNEDYELPVPATFIINQEGVVVERFVNIDYTQRMDPTEVLEALASIDKGSR